MFSLFRRNARKAKPARRTSRSVRPGLEALEERCLLDANPQVQLSADLGKLSFDMTRATIDAAVFADEVALASGVETPAGIAGLAALGPLMRSPGMVSDVANLVKDLREENIAGITGDLLSLAPETFLQIGGDVITLRQDGMAVANDLTHLLTGTPIPQSKPAPTSTTTFAGTYSADLYPSVVDGNVNPGTKQHVVLTLNADGSGSMSISPFGGAPLMFNFPAGTAHYYASVGKIDLAYTTANKVDVAVDAALSSDGNTISGDIDFVGTLAPYDEALFRPGTLNKQT